MHKVLFSSKSCEWATPPDLFDALNRRFLFTLDPCATPENAKCTRFYTQADDGLRQDWTNERVFMNPPYGRGIEKWMAKAYHSAQAGALCVCLVPSRTCTRWWHDYVMKGKILFMKGRIHFINAANDQQFPAPFASSIVVFSKGMR